MNCRAVIIVLAVIGLPLGATALEGSGDSAVGALETVRPTLDSISVLSEAGIEATFSEPMLAPGVSTPGNYAVSDLGAGSLSANPDGVTGSGPYALTWAAGEMRDGETVTVTGTGMQDAVGNPIDTSANSASTTAVGVPPVFSGLTVDPAQASADETVTITFASSEDLDGDPMVVVNGNAATFVSGTKATNFVYDYVVQQTDPLGPATIMISGFDLAGNLGTLESTTALEIVESAYELPIRWHALAGVLALVAMALLALRRRKGAALLVLLLLAAPMALAQGPTVSNVDFVQHDNGAGGTEVVITYDLDAPNGPCDITVSLSKDGGTDGFVHPVTSLTGDLSGVATGTDKQIVWDIRADYPDEDIPNAQLRVTADDGLALFTLIYSAGPGGSIDGDTSQSVVEGNDGTQVEALPNMGYHFVAWSDGLLTATRQDTAVTGDIDVTANFESDSEMVSIPAGSFEMGRPYTDTGQAIEVPVHTVNISAYQIGKYEVTNQEVVDVYNWADDQGYFDTVEENTAEAYGQQLLYMHTTLSNCQITYSDGVFSPESRDGHSMADHPVVEISWYGAAAYCNWLSEIEGREACYNTSTWDCDFSKNGYRLPTEAEWERAAAWDPAQERHYRYANSSDSISSSTANYFYNNPLGLSSAPYTSPVGYYAGVTSPAGCYDMSGNVWEWCNDWAWRTYTSEAVSDPEGPSSGSHRVLRGGGWNHYSGSCRSAGRIRYEYPSSKDGMFGFRLAR